VAQAAEHAENKQSLPLLSWHLDAWSEPVVPFEFLGVAPGHETATDEVFGRGVFSAAAADAQCAKLGVGIGSRSAGWKPPNCSPKGKREPKLGEYWE